MLAAESPDLSACHHTLKLRNTRIPNNTGRNQQFTYCMYSICILFVYFVLENSNNIPYTSVKNVLCISKKLSKHRLNSYHVKLQYVVCYMVALCSLFFRHRVIAYCTHSM